MLFTVIIPVYNVERYIKDCIESILKNDLSDCEILCIDDGATDNCPAILDSYADKYENIRVIHKENGGLISARNTGIKNALGEYILYVDGDDKVSDDYIVTIKKAVENAPHRPDLVVFGADKIYEKKTVECIINTEEGYYDKEALKTKIYPRLMSDRRLNYGESVVLPAPWNRAYKRELLLKHYCKDEGIRIGEDTAFTFECFLAAEDAVLIKDVLYYYNKTNPDSILSKAAGDRFKKRERLYGYIDEHLKEYDEFISDQKDDFFASRIIMDIIFLGKMEGSVSEKAKMLREKFNETDLLRYVNMANIPPKALLFILLLKMHMYRTVILVTGMVKGDAD